MCGIESPEGEQRMAARAKVSDILVADCSGRYKLCVTIRLKRFAVLSVTVCLSLETWGQAAPGNHEATTTRPPDPFPDSFSARRAHFGALLASYQIALSTPMESAHGRKSVRTVS